MHKELTFYVKKETLLKIEEEFNNTKIVSKFGYSKSYKFEDHIKMTMSFELPEPKKELSRSEIDEALRTYATNEDALDKLFGEQK